MEAAVEIASDRCKYKAIKAGVGSAVPLGTAFPMVLAAPLKRRQWQQNYSVYETMMSVELIYFSLFNYYF